MKQSQDQYQDKNRSFYTNGNEEADALLVLLEHAEYIIAPTVVTKITNVILTILQNTKTQQEVIQMINQLINELSIASIYSPSFIAEIKTRLLSINSQQLNKQNCCK